MVNKHKCPVCNKDVEKGIKKNHAHNEEHEEAIRALITPNDNVINECARLYKLSHYKQKGNSKTGKLELDEMMNRLPNDLCDVALDSIEKRMATGEAVAFGLPVPLLSKTYNTSVRRNRMEYLNEKLRDECRDNLSIN